MVSLAFVGGLAKGLHQGMEQKKKNSREKEQVEDRKLFLEEQIARDNRRLEQEDRQLEIHEKRNQQLGMNSMLLQRQGLLAEIGDTNLNFMAQKGVKAAQDKLEGLRGSLRLLDEQREGLRTPAARGGDPLIPATSGRDPAKRTTPDGAGTQASTSGFGGFSGGEADPVIPETVQRPDFGIEEQAEAFVPPKDIQLAIDSGLIPEEMAERDAQGNLTGRAIAENDLGAKAMQKKIEDLAINVPILTRTGIAKETQERAKNQAIASMRVGQMIGNPNGQIYKRLVESGFEIDVNGNVLDAPERKSEMLDIPGFLLAETKNFPEGKEASAAWYRTNVLPNFLDDPESLNKFFVSEVNPRTGQQEFRPNYFKMSLGRFNSLNDILDVEFSLPTGGGSNFHPTKLDTDTAAMREKAARQIDARVRSWSPIAPTNVGRGSESGPLRNLLRTGQAIRKQMTGVLGAGFELDESGVPTAELFDLPEVLENEIDTAIDAQGTLIDAALEISEGKITLGQAAEMKSSLRRFYRPKQGGKFIFRPIPEIQRKIDQLTERIDGAVSQDLADDVDRMLREELDIFEDEDLDFFQIQRNEDPEASNLESDPEGAQRKIEAADRGIKARQSRRGGADFERQRDFDGEESRRRFEANTPPLSREDRDRGAGVDRSGGPEDETLTTGRAIVEREMEKASMRELEDELARRRGAEGRQRRAGGADFIRFKDADEDAIEAEIARRRDRTGLNRKERNRRASLISHVLGRSGS